MTCYMLNSPALLLAGPTKDLHLLVAWEVIGLGIPSMSSSSLCCIDVFVQFHPSVANSARAR